MPSARRIASISPWNCGSAQAHVVDFVRRHVVVVRCARAAAYISRPRQAPDASVMRGGAAHALQRRDLAAHKRGSRHRAPRFRAARRSARSLPEFPRLIRQAAHQRLHQHVCVRAAAGERIELQECAIDREVRRDHARAGVFGHDRGLLHPAPTKPLSARDSRPPRHACAAGAVVHKVRHRAIRARELRHRIRRARAAADFERRIAELFSHEVATTSYVTLSRSPAALAIDRAQLAQRSLVCSRDRARRLRRIAQLVDEAIAGALFGEPQLVQRSGDSRRDVRDGASSVALSCSLAHRGVSGTLPPAFRRRRNQKEAPRPPAPAPRTARREIA
jgi:hypothetical protein